MWLSCELKIPLNEVRQWSLEEIASWLAFFKVQREHQNAEAQRAKRKAGR